MIFCKTGEDGVKLQIDGDAEQLIEETANVISSIAEEYSKLFDASKTQAAKTFIVARVTEEVCKKASVTAFIAGA